jgi:hypothetical protein
MKKLILGLATLAIATTAGAFGPAERRAKQLAAYEPAGKAVSCIDIRSIDSTQVLSNTVIDFKMRGGKVYRNTLSYSCPGLSFEDSFSYRTSSSQLCSVDIIRVLQSTGSHLQEGAACGLGTFQPMQKLPALEDASYTPADWAPFEVINNKSATQ